MSTATMEFAAEGVDFQQFARDKAMEWSHLCRQFLDATRKEILLGDPSPEKLRAHRAATKWLLRMARAIHMTAADPDFADRRIADELEGRVIQLGHIWSQIHDPMPEAGGGEIVAGSVHGQSLPGFSDRYPPEMKSELEALVLAFDALQEGRPGGSDVDRLQEIYRSRLEDVLARHPGVEYERLKRAVEMAHARWVKAQRKFPRSRFSQRFAQQTSSSLPRRDLRLRFHSSKPKRKRCQAVVMAT